MPPRRYFHTPSGAAAGQRGNVMIRATVFSIRTPQELEEIRVWQRYAKWRRDVIERHREWTYAEVFLPRLVEGAYEELTRAYWDSRLVTVRRLEEVGSFVSGTHLSLVRRMFGEWRARAAPTAIDVLVNAQEYLAGELSRTLRFSEWAERHPWAAM